MSNENEENEKSNEAERIRNEAGAVVAIDLPRMLRSDATRLSEMIAKYRGLEGAEGMVAYLLDARAAVLAYTPGAVTEFVGRGPEFVREGELPAGEQAQLAASIAAGAQPPADGISYDAGGRDALITEVLVRTGLLSSSARAKLAIRDGIVKIDGKPVAPTRLLAPGSYQLTMGEDGWSGALHVR